MKKLLSIILAAMMLAGAMGCGISSMAAAVEPNEDWAVEYGWIKKGDRYEKTVEGICYQLWCGRTAYDKLINADYHWQIMTVSAEEASGVVAIPNEIDGFPVKSIGADTFRANKNVTECIISEGILLIATGAFENCRSITKVRFGDGLKMIDANAFYNCPNLSSLKIPATVEYIGRTAFCGKTVSGTGLESLHFEGNAPQILYITENDNVLSTIKDVTVNVYEHTRGWNQEPWKNVKINYIKNEEITPPVTPEETKEPQPTEVPEITKEPQPTEVPEVTKEPQPTTAPGVSEIFTDVDQDWYTEAVQYVYDKGLMKGLKGTERFQPFGFITKAQAVQVLYNMEGSPKPAGESVFQKVRDVYPEEWYANAIAWAYECKIVTGDLNTKKFYPNQGITREELALVFYRYAAYKQMNMDVQNDLTGFRNGEKVNDWALKGMRWAVGTKLLHGIELKTQEPVYDLAPFEKTSRAQAAVIIRRFLELDKI